VLNIVWMLAGWLLGWWLFGRPTTLHVTRPLQGQPARRRFSVIVPARNEEQSLPNLLAALEVARPAGAEVIVVDDGSTDDTLAVARSFDGVRVLSAGPAPEGWVGKPWACHVGAQASSSETFLFVDADVRVEPGALEAVVGELDERGGLVSVEPFHFVERTYERVSALLGTVSFMGIGAGATGERATNGAFGPVMATSRADYEATGGHEAVRGEIVEDMALARAYESQGLPVKVLVGDRNLGFRMYPDGPRSLVEGWTKNLATGASHTPGFRLAGAVVWLTAMGSVVATFVRVAGQPAPTLAVLALYGAFAVQLRHMFSHLGNFGPLAYLLFPLQLLAFFAIFFRSLWFTLVRRRVRWRGREVPLPTGKR